MTAVAFLALAAAGAVARAAVAGRLDRPGRVAAGTLTVNLTGSFMLGLLSDLDASAAATLLGTALLGAFTTFSAFAAQAVALAEARRRLAAGLYVAVSVVGGVVAAACGRALG